MFNSPSGIFYLETNAQSPYGQGLKGVEAVKKKLDKDPKFKTTLYDKFLGDYVPPYGVFDRMGLKTCKTC